MLERFSDFIARYRLFAPADRVLLAVSGGRDSVCMAHLAREAGVDFAIAHCNFHLRPGDCDRDQAFVARLASGLGVPFFATGFDTHAYASAHGYSLEQAARLLRYSYFASLCRGEGFACVATAHHLDDSVETFFLNLFRGTGLAGLHGIRPVSHLRAASTEADGSPSELTVVHPMLGFSRADIDRYLALHGLDYVDDATNFEPDVQRNRIRLQLMPLLRELYPSVDATMQANIERLHEAGQVVDAHVDGLRSRLRHRVPCRLPWLHLGIDAFAVADLTALSPRRTLLFELLRPYGFAPAVAAEIDRRLPVLPAGLRFCSSSHEAVADRGRLLVAPLAAVQAPQLDVAEAVLPPHPPRRPGVAYVAPVGLQHSLLLRPWRSGDRFHPFGMEGERLVSDFLKDLKLNAIEKRHVHLLTTADGEVVWVVGLRADNRFRVSAPSEPCLQISLRADKGSLAGTR